MEQVKNPDTIEETENSYFISNGSDNQEGQLYIDKGQGYSLVSYSIVEGKFHFLILDFKRDLGSLKSKIKQISKADADAVLNGVKRWALNL